MIIEEEREREKEGEMILVVMFYLERSLGFWGIIIISARGMK